MYRRILDDALAAHEKSQTTKPATIQPNVWRIIMKSRITKLATASAVILLILFGISILDRAATPAWAVEQTIEAFEEIHTVIITGMFPYGSESIPFKSWIKLDDENNNLFMRYESEKEVVVVRGNVCYSYMPESKRVTIVDGKAIHNLKFWYKVLELSPWITCKTLPVLKLFADDWQETYEKDGQTGRDRVVVTCSYKPLRASFWFEFDLESKLLVQGKHWRNIHRQGPPTFYATTFVYNEDIPDEVFEFEIPEGAKVVHEKQMTEASALFDQGEELFHNKRQFAEAIKIYWEVYEKYPDLKMAETALMMIGICYDHMQQYGKAIEVYEKAIREYSNLKGWIEATYFYLGAAYFQTGQKDKALEAFKNCLLIGEGVRDPEKFPLKNARKYIEKLKSHR